MSTRCQVKVQQRGMGWEEAVTLYHHTDGYPTYMLPLIQTAYAPDWQHGRAGKVASFLCAVDPGTFEPEEGHALHQDIEYYYVLTVESDGSVSSLPHWTIEVFDVHGFGEEQTLESRGIYPIKEAVKKAKQIEQMT